MYFHAIENLLGFDLSMEEDFWVIQLPKDLSNQPLTIGVATEELPSELVREMLLL